MPLIRLFRKLETRCFKTLWTGLFWPKAGWTFVARPSEQRHVLSLCRAATNEKAVFKFYNPKKSRSERDFL